MKNKKPYNKPRPEIIKPKEEIVVEEVKEPAVEEIKYEETIVDKEIPAVVDGVKMSLNIRMVPKVEANNQIGILQKGTKLFVIENGKVTEADNEEWYKVKFGDPPQVGYAMKKYIKMV